MNLGSSMSQRKGRRLFKTDDDTSTLMKLVEATHISDGHQFNVKPFIQMVNHIFIQPIVRTIEVPDEKQEQDTFEPTTSMLDSHGFIIYKISSKLSGKYDSGDRDSHGSTMVLLKYMANYAWHAKVALTFSAFGSTFLKFWHIAKRPQFDALKKLIKAAMDLTMRIVEFKEMPSEYISEDFPALSILSALIPTAAYWVIRSIVACASQLASLEGTRNESSSPATETSEISSLAQKISSMYEQVMSPIAQCNKHIDDKKHIEAFQNLTNIHEFTVDITILTDNLPLLIDGTTGSKVSLKELMKKHVLLLISDLDISQEEIEILDFLYKDARVREINYEIVWIPVVETWGDVNQNKFEELWSMMSWYSVSDPSIIEPSIIKYIKEVWKFTKRFMVVVLDPQGKVSSSNARHMMWIWRNLAFPFSSEKEESLWKEEIWSLGLLVDGIDPMILDWIVQGKFICLYGGEDVEWIQKFTTTAMTVAKACGFKLEMVYVGKSNPKERVRKMIRIIDTRKLSYFWSNVTTIWFFWARLESMLYSKLQQGRTIENDQIMREVLTLLSYDGSDEGWALFCKGSFEMARTKGDLALTALRDFDNWKDNFARIGFVPALNVYLQQLQTPQHATRLILPATVGDIPDILVCSECGRRLEKYVAYRHIEE